MMNDAELARWLKDRFSNEKAKRQWRSLLESTWDRFLETKVIDLLPPDRIEALVLAHLTKERLVGIVHSVIRTDLAMSVEIMRADHQKLARWVPDEAKKAIHALVSKKGFADPEWVRSIFKEKAIEAIVADTLFNAIRDFSKIIPRIIQSKLGRLGAIYGKVIDEMDKMIEPEIRRFLDKGTRRALDGAAGFAVDHIDDPSSLEFRRNMINFVLDQEAAFHVRALSDEVIVEIDKIAELICRHVADREETKLRAQEVIARAKAKYGDRRLMDALEEIGIGREHGPPFDALAEVTWPLVLGALESEAAEAWFGHLASDISAAMSKA